MLGQRRKWWAKIKNHRGGQKLDVAHYIIYHVYGKAVNITNDSLFEYNVDL